jgi:hypothetical protein
MGQLMTISQACHHGPNRKSLINKLSILWSFDNNGTLL